MSVLINTSERHYVTQEDLKELEDNFLKQCELTRHYVQDKEELETRLALGRQKYEKSKAELERQIRIQNETSPQRLARLKLEYEARPVDPILPWKIAQLERKVRSRHSLVPHDSVGNLSISESGDLVMASSCGNVTSLWCFRDVEKNAKLTSATSVVEYQYDVRETLRGFIDRNHVAVGRSPSDICGTAATKDQQIFFISSQAVGLAKYDFLDEITSKEKASTSTGTSTSNNVNGQSLSPERVKMAENLRIGLISSVVSVDPMPPNKSGGRLKTMSCFPDGRIVTGCERGSFAVWDGREFHRLGSIEKSLGPKGILNALKALPETYDTFTASDFSRGLRIFDLRKRDAVVGVHEWKENMTAFGCPEELGSGGFIVGTENGTLLSLDLRQMTNSSTKDKMLTPINTFDFDAEDPEDFGKQGERIQDILFTSDGKRFCAIRRNEIQCFSNEKSGEFATTRRYETGASRSIQSGAIHGEWIWTAEFPGTIVKRVI